MAYLEGSLIADVDDYRLAARDESLRFLNINATGAVRVNIGFDLVVGAGGIGCAGGTPIRGIAAQYEDSQGKH